MQQAIYLIGAGPLATKTFVWAQECGLKVIATDKNDKAPGKELADEFSCIDASDNTGKHEWFAERVSTNYKIVGVYCGNEIGTHNVARIQKKLGLPYLEQSTISLLSDKYQMKDALKKLGICSPAYYKLESPKELKALLTSASKPLVIKPSLGSGSRGVLIAYPHDAKKADEIWVSCLQDVDNQGHVIAEEYIEGPSIDVNAIIYDGELYPAGLLEKYISTPPQCLPLGGHAPIDIDKPQERNIFATLEKACSATGIHTGPVKADFIICSKTGQAYLLELAARFHGDITTCNTLPQSLGINPLKAIFNLWLTGNSKNELVPTKNGFATWRVLCLPPGIQYSQHIANQYHESQGISVVWLNEKHSAKIASYSNTRDIPGYICAFGSDQDETNTHISNWFKQHKHMLASVEKNTWYKGFRHALEPLQQPLDSFCYFQ